MNRCKVIWPRLVSIVWHWVPICKQQFNCKIGWKCNFFPPRSLHFKTRFLMTQLAFCINSWTKLPSNDVVFRCQSEISIGEYWKSYFCPPGKTLCIGNGRNLCKKLSKESGCNGFFILAKVLVNKHERLKYVSAEFCDGVWCPNFWDATLSFEYTN